MCIMMQLGCVLLNSSTFAHFCLSVTYSRNTEVTAERDDTTEICQKIHFCHKASTCYVVCIWGKKVL